MQAGNYRENDQAKLRGRPHVIQQMRPPPLCQPVYHISSMCSRPHRITTSSSESNNMPRTMTDSH